MNIRRRTKNIIAALLAMVLCLTGFLPSSGMQTVRAEEKEAKIWFKDSEDNADSGKSTFVPDKGGIVYASVEKFTVGQGYLIEPTEVSFEAGETYADIIEKLLKANGYTYDAQNTGMGFYLNIPQCISNMSEDAPTNDKHKSNPYKDTQGLGEFSYSNYSGWYYFVNNENPGLGMGGVKAKDGDVVRYQFTLYGLGADLGDKPNDQTGGIKALELPNKDSVTKNLALMRQILAKDDKADPEGIYKNVLKIVTNMDSTKEQFAQAEQRVSAWLAEYPQKKAERDRAEKEKAEREKAAKEAALQKKYTPAKTTLRSIKNAGKNKVRLTWEKSIQGYRLRNLPQHKEKRHLQKNKNHQQKQNRIFRDQTAKKERNLLLQSPYVSQSRRQSLLRQRFRCEKQKSKIEKIYQYPDVHPESRSPGGRFLCF